MPRRLLDDPFLKPYEDAIRGRSARAFARADELTRGEALADWANGYNYFGLHRVRGGWVFREWAPNASEIYLAGDFSGWQLRDEFKLRRIGLNNVWEGKFPARQIAAGQRYHLVVRWPGGEGERIPSYARYVLQDPQTKLFEACVWESKYRWRHDGAKKGEGGEKAPFVYEAHIGMGTEQERVGSYGEFRRDILPRIKAAGYDTVQLMAIAEHPYYGSFGYHVSSFFAASSRFGTPDELKALIDEAHGLGLRVIMDLVHSHAVANERDGLSRFDGTDYQYFHAGAKGYHSAWGSRCFDYGKPEVVHFLLSNAKFWLDEYHFDGYRFDGVTSMLFWNHGLGDAFINYGMYFNGSVDDDAWVYLQLANRVIHEVRPDALTIAEDVSGMPGVAAPVGDFGLGFDYRMAMGVPDFWFRLAERVRDDDWPMGGIFHELTNKRAEERVVSYVECHDQALVGGKTFFFTLADAAIYYGMARGQHALEIERAIALHKLARLATASLAGGAYLTFMGNEFGHPEWIDFPREENGWNYHHARRQWSLRDDPRLRFGELAAFDAAMLAALREGRAVYGERARYGRDVVRLVADEGDKVLAFLRGDLLFVFNFHPVRSYVDYGILVPPASRWRHVLDSDERRFGGQGRIRGGDRYSPLRVPRNRELVEQIRLYLPSRTATVLKLASGA